MKCLTAALVLGSVISQQPGHQKSPEYKPPMGLSTCSKSGGCQKAQLSMTMDANWRWLHKVGTYTNCYTDDANSHHWDPSDCPDPKTCAQNCALDPVPPSDMKAPYGVSSDGTTLKLDFVTQGAYSRNVGSRLYMMQDEDNYQMFKLKNKEFTFTVDDSQLGCGINGALYFVQMDQDGGKSRFPGNACGAKFGTGYCDAQCPHDIKFINGEANILGWNATSGMGKMGTCCAEMDIWEANTMGTAYTAHPCSVMGQTRCEDPVSCGDGKHRFEGNCDKDGCDLNPYRAGNKTFWGKGSNYAVDSSQPVTVVTQFITDDGTDSGTLKEIRRLFVQNGKVIPEPMSNLGGDKEWDSLTDESCAGMKAVFGDTNDFKRQGGMAQMSKQLDAGMVLVMSLWDDHSAYMLWLDSTYPTDKTSPGGPRGDCPTSSGRPNDVESQTPGAYVKFSDVRFGEIGSTYKDMVGVPMKTL